MPVMNEDAIKKCQGEIERLKAHMAYLESGSPNLGDIIKRELEAALKRNGGNRTWTAEQLGVSLRTVRNWINEYGLK